MRKLKLQVQMSVDGFIGGPNGEMDWLTFPWSKDIEDYVTELTSSVDTIVLGRKLAEGFIPHWAAVAADPNNPEVEAGKAFTNKYKVVFSKTMTSSPWANTDIANGDILEEINKLKNKEGKDIIAYGGASFVSSLIRHNLIDEYHLFINTAAIGSGLPIFKEMENYRKLKLVNAKGFDCGITLLNYEPAMPVF
jgi:dihydrofolate reductase